ncbi:MAG: L-histidine N(alpha)-methyltransferase, partial [Okeania sp. SIO2D1]|nr:L-histidine N(alpha)-methyltransferase [Okeania sp. SIO2D1]
LVQNFTKPVVFFKGSTITNLSTSNCLKFFGRISQALKPDGILIVGVDANQNESSLRGAYDTEIVAKFVLNIFHFMNRDLPITNFNSAAFKYEFEWLAPWHCVKHNANATKEQNFVLDGISINIKKGTKFHLLSSYKYPVDYFQNLAIEGGLKPIDYFVDENQPMVIHVLGVS